LNLPFGFRDGLLNFDNGFFDQSIGLPGRFLLIKPGMKNHTAGAKGAGPFAGIQDALFTGQQQEARS
jgi:hypothetical protein